MNRQLLITLLCFTTPLGAHAATWLVDGAVGVSQVEFTLQITCPAPSFACSLIDGYSEVQTSTLAGSSTFQLDLANELIQFDTDSTQDVGAGPQPAYLTMSGSDLTFAFIPFAGVPELVNVLIFSLSDPPINIPGINAFAPGDYPFAATLSYASLADVVGDLEFVLPNLVIPGSGVAVAGTFRVLGDIDFDGRVEYQLRDMTGTLAVQTAGTIGGEPVTLDVTAVLTANLSGEVALGPPPDLVPTVGPFGLAVLAGLLVRIGVRKI
jgi:hypothetical protein